MGKGFKILLTASLLATASLARADTAAERFAPKRGLNLDIWVDWRGVQDMVDSADFLAVYPEWLRYVSAESLQRLPASGFDFVRLPMDPAPLLAMGPGLRQDALIADIVAITSRLQGLGLKVIVDLHSVPRPDEAWGTDSIVNDAALFAAHVALTGKVAAALNGMNPERTAIEVLNEPTNDCTAVYDKITTNMQWPAQMMQLHAAARAAAPDLPVVLSGACWGGIDGLELIDPAMVNDDNVIWSFHSYDPFVFTHQGASWVQGPEQYFTRMPYPGGKISDVDAANLVTAAIARAAGRADPWPHGDQDLRDVMEGYRTAPPGLVADAPLRAAKWADTHGIARSRMVLGEFGAMRQDASGARLDRQDRARFLADKRLAAEANGIGWAVWSWSSNFGIAGDTPDRVPEPGVCAALGLTC